METLHEWTEIFANLEVSDRRVVITQQGRDPRDEPKFLAVVIEAIPENVLRLFRFKGVYSIARFGGEKIDRVIAIPVFKAVLALEELMGGV